MALQDDVTGECQQWRTPKEQDLADEITHIVGQVASETDRLFVAHLFAMAREAHRTPSPTEPHP